MSNQLPSWIKPDTKDAYNYAYTFLYCKLQREVRVVVDNLKGNDALQKSLVDATDYASRTARDFFKEVKRMAEYHLPFEELKALERREKAEGIHPSQQKPVEVPKVDVLSTVENQQTENQSNNPPANNDNQAGNAS